MSRTVSNLTAAAVGQWDAVLPGLGIEVPARGKHGPCPSCGGVDRFHFDDLDGRGTWHCRGCDAAGDGLDLVKRVAGIDTTDAAKQVAGYLGMVTADNRELIEANRKRASERKAADAAAIEAQQRRTAARAADIMRDAVEGESTYLAGKGFTCTASVNAHVIRLADHLFQPGCLVVPMIDSAGNLANVQLIDGDGTRAYLPGKGTKAGRFHLIEGEGDCVALAEGYASALSVSMATGWPTYAAFDSSNLPNVIEGIAARHPDKTIVIAGDHDCEDQQGRRAGHHYAEKAAALVSGAVIAMPADEGSDWDDYRQAHGIEATGDAIRACLVQTPAPAKDDVPPTSLTDAVVQGELSEDALALIFERRHAGDLRFCHTAGAWYVWTGNRWQIDKRQRAFNWAREVCREFAQGQVKFSRASVASAVERFATAAPSMAVDGSIWDQTPWLIATPGGVVDLRTGELRPAAQEDHITRSAAMTPENRAPERWLAFLNDATRGDGELIRFLQQMAGYCLTGTTTEHALFFIYGAGGNGKSVFLNTLTGILGEYAQTAAMDTFTASKHDKHPTDLAMLKGARLVTASETEDGRAWAEAKIKQMTGGDPITARFMRRDFFTYTPEFKLVIVGNHKPQLSNVDDATKRRFNIIPFIHRPTTPDPDLETALRDEWPAILSWMIQGALDWQQNGLVRPPVVVEATREYFEEQDLFGQWLDDCCDVDPAYQDTSKALFASWRRFAEQNGEHAGTAKSFGSTMVKRGLQAFRTKHGRGFLGVRVAPEPARYDPRDPGAWD